MTSRIAVLASGGGSNLQAILDHFDALGDRRGGSVVVVGTDRSTAGALERAERGGIPSLVIAPEARDGAQSIDRLIDEHGVDLIALAGYVKMIPTHIVSRFEGRLVNVHPALLPAFGGRGMYGNRVHHAVIKSGARVSGVTVHFVDAGVDTGPIIAQKKVEIRDSDSVATLGRRQFEAAVPLLLHTVRMLENGRQSPFDEPDPELAQFSARYCRQL